MPYLKMCDEDLILPKRESMHYHKFCRNYFSYNKEAYKWISRFLISSVGKKFDVIYAKVCEKFKKKKDLEFRKEFKSRIDPHNIRSGNKYYLDSNNILREYSSNKNPRIKKYEVELDRSKDYYIVNKEKLAKYPEIILYLKSKISKDIDYVIFSDGKLSEGLGKRVQKYIGEAICDYNTECCYSRDRLSVNDFIKCCYDSKTQIFYKGTPEYAKNYYECKDLKQKLHRERIKKTEESHAEMLVDSLIRRKVNSIMNNITLLGNHISLRTTNNMTNVVKDWVIKKRTKKILN